MNIDASLEESPRPDDEVRVLGRVIEAMSQLDDPAALERVLTYLIARYWPPGVDQVVCLRGADKIVHIELGRYPQ